MPSTITQIALMHRSGVRIESDIGRRFGIGARLNLQGRRSGRKFSGKAPRHACPPGRWPSIDDLRRLEYQSERFGIAAFQGGVELPHTDVFRDGFPRLLFRRVVLLEFEPDFPVPDCHTEARFLPLKRLCTAVVDHGAVIDAVIQSYHMKVVHRRLRSVSGGDGAPSTRPPHPRFPVSHRLWRFRCCARLLIHHERALDAFALGGFATMVAKPADTAVAPAIPVAVLRLPLSARARCPGRRPRRAWRRPPWRSTPRGRSRAFC